MSEIVKSEYNALGEDNNYKTHYFKTSVDQVVGLGRRKSTKYEVSDVVYIDTNLSVALKCTQTGTTSNTELDISGNNIGDTVTDGGVVWKVIERNISGGGTISGYVLFSELDSALMKPEDDGAISICAGKNINTSASISLYGSDFAGDGSENGEIRFRAGSNNNGGVQNFVQIGAKINDFRLNGQQIAVNNKLSMPSTNVITVDIAEASANETTSMKSVNVYNAPCDGWFYVEIPGIVNDKRTLCTLSIVETGIRVRSTYVNLFSGHLLFIPVAKGQNVCLTTVQTQAGQAWFAYAQSEV